VTWDGWFTIPLKYHKRTDWGRAPKNEERCKKGEVNSTRRGGDWAFSHAGEGENPPCRAHSRVGRVRQSETHREKKSLAEFYYHFRGKKKKKRDRCPTGNGCALHTLWGPLASVPGGDIVQKSWFHYYLPFLRRKEGRGDKKSICPGSQKYERHECQAQRDMQNITNNFKKKGEERAF